MLKTDDYRRLFAVLEDTERATSLSSFRRGALDALSAHLGWTHGAFLTGSTDSERIEGVALGIAQRRLDALIARLSRVPATRRLLGAAHLDLGHALTREDLWSVLDDGGRAVGDEFAAAEGLRALLGVWLDPPGATKGLLVLASGIRAPAASDRERLEALVPHLTNLLALHTPHDAAASSTAALTPREAETVDLVAAGLGNRAIARQLNVTESTVKKHVSSALTKLGLDSRTQLALAWLGTEGRNGGKRPRRVPARS